MTNINYTTEETQTEEWRVAVGFPGYEVSNAGRLRSYKRKAMAYMQVAEPKLPDRPNKYCRANITGPNGKQPRGVHQLVMAAFIGPPPEGLTINHKNGKKWDNRLDNLEYITPKANSQHAVALGLTPIGEDVTLAKLTNEQAAEVVNLLAQGHTATDVARRFDLSVPAVSKIKQGGTWKHIPRPESPYLGRLPYTGSAKGIDQFKAKLTEADVVDIRQRADDGTRNVVLAAEFHVSDTLISAVVTRKIWSHVESPARQHAPQYPGMRKGADHICAKLTENDVRNIRRMSKEGATYKELAAIFGVNFSNIGHIVKRHTWKHVD